MDNDYSEAARNFYGLIDRNAREAPPSSPVPKATVDAIVEAGLHGLMVPKDVGGAEAPIVECIDAIAGISRADGSAGWCLMANAATIAFFGAWGGDDFASELFAHGVPLAAGQFAPNGTAEPDGDGYRITGDYRFGSGINHSDWIGAGVLTTEDPSRLLMALVPRSKVKMQGGWDDVLGLQATASWDYTIRDVWVPEGATFEFFTPTLHRGGPMYELGVLGLTSAGHAGFAIGVVRRALDELREIARTKARMGASAPLRDKESFIIAHDARRRAVGVVHHDDGMSVFDFERVDHVDAARATGGGGGAHDEVGESVAIHIAHGGRCAKTLRAVIEFAADHLEARVVDVVRVRDVRDARAVLRRVEQVYATAAIVEVRRANQQIGKAVAVHVLVLPFANRQHV